MVLPQDPSTDPNCARLQVTDTEDVSYVASPWLPQVLRKRGREASSNAHRAHESGEGRSTIVDDLDEVITLRYVLRVFPPCALVPRVQGSSGAVATMQFVWRGHAQAPTTRAGPWPDFALRLE